MLWMLKLLAKFSQKINVNGRRIYGNGQKIVKEQTFQFAQM